MMNKIFEFIPFLQASGIETSVIAQILFYSLPPVLMIAVPISMMIGVYVGISRLSSDSELIAMRASGVSLSFFLKPVVILATIVAVFVMGQTFYLSPIGIQKLDALKFNILKRQTKINLAVQQINNFFGQKLIYIFEKKGDRFEGIFITDWHATPESSLIEAKSGQINLDEKQHNIIFQLENGKIHNTIGKEGYRIIEFEKLDSALSPPSINQKNLPNRFKNNDGSLRTRLDTELTVNELVSEIKRLPPKSDTYFEYVDEFHSRIVTTLSCICFAIFALPMGIFNPRSPKSGNVVYMVLVLIVYFLIYAQIRAQVVQGTISAVALYLSLLFVVINGYVRYFKINQNIDSFWGYLIKRRKEKWIS